MVDGVSSSNGDSAAPVAVFDAAWVGHVPIYHREVCAAFHSLGHPVYSIAPAACEKDQTRNPFPHREGPWPRRQWSPVPSSVDPRTTWQSVREHLDEIAAERGKEPVAYFPWVDFCFLSSELPPQALDREMPFVWGGLVLRPTYPPRSWWRQTKSREALLHATRCSGVHLLNENLADHYRAWLSGKFVGEFPDVTDLSRDPMQRRFLGLTSEPPDDVPTFVFPGNICLRKGFDWFVDAAWRAKKQNRNWRFHAIGEFSISSAGSVGDYKRIARLLDRKPGVTMTAFPARIPDADINAVIASATGVWCHYRDFPWSSNVMVKAARFGVPIVAAECGVIGNRVRDYQLGESASEGSARQIDAALTRMADVEWRSVWERRQRCAEFASRHDRGRLASCLQQWLTASLQLQRMLGE